MGGCIWVLLCLGLVVFVYFVNSVVCFMLFDFYLVGCVDIMSASVS